MAHKKTPDQTCTPKQVKCLLAFKDGPGYLHQVGTRKAMDLVRKGLVKMAGVERGELTSRGRQLIDGTVCPGCGWTCLMHSMVRPRSCKLGLSCWCVRTDMKAPAAPANFDASWFTDAKEVAARRLRTQKLLLEVAGRASDG